MKFKLILGIIVLLYIISTCFFSVTDKEYVITTRFGKPIKIIIKSGLHKKLPLFFEKINRFDKRLQSINTTPIQLILKDQNPLIITLYGIWKINKPLKYFQTLSNNPKLTQERLIDLLNSQLATVVSEYTINNFLNIDTQQIKISEIENKVQLLSNKICENYGLKILDLGVKRLNYPSIVENSVYERMISERKKTAKKIRAEGLKIAAKIESEADKQVSDIRSNADKTASIIKADADKQAMEIYNKAYSQSLDFFEYTKSLDLYSKILNDKTTFIFSTKSKLFKFLNGSDSFLFKVK